MTNALEDEELKLATIKVDAVGAAVRAGAAPAASKGVPKTTTVDGEDHVVRVSTDAHGQVTVHVDTESVRDALQARQKLLAGGVGNR